MAGQIMMCKGKLKASVHTSEVPNYERRGWTCDDPEQPTEVTEEAIDEPEDTDE